MSETIFFGSYKAGESGAPKVVLFGFGKHPAWSEHQQSLGKSSESLLRLRQRLYWEGIQKFSNTWEGLQGEARCESDHWLVSCQPGRIQVSRVVSTADASGRKASFIAAAEVTGCPLELALRRLAPALDEFTQRCLKLPNGKAVEAAFASEPGTMESLLARAASDLAPLALSAEERANFTANPDWDAQGLALGRLLYKVESSWIPFASLRDGKAPKIQSGVALRVPALAGQMAASVLLWEEFNRFLVHHDVPRFYIVPAAHEWLDLVVGELEASHFKGLQAGRKNLGLETEVPHSIGLELQAQAQAILAAWRAGTPLPVPNRPVSVNPDDTTTRFFQRQDSKTEFKPLLPSNPVAPASGIRETQRSKTPLVVIGLVAAILLIAAIGFLFFHSQAGTTEKPEVTKIEARASDPPPVLAPEFTEAIAAQHLVENGQDLVLNLPVKVQPESVSLDKLTIETIAEPAGIVQVYTNFANSGWQLLLKPIRAGSAEVTVRAIDERKIPGKRMTFGIEVNPKPAAPH